MRKLLLISVLAFTRIQAQQVYEYDTITRTLNFLYANDTKVSHTVHYENFVSFRETWTFYFSEGTKIEQYSKCNSQPCDTQFIWTNSGSISEMKIYTDSTLTHVDFWLETGKIYEIGIFKLSNDSAKSYTIIDSTLFAEYESIPCEGHCYKRTQLWCTFHSNGQLESQGYYLGDEFVTAIPTKDSAGVAMPVARDYFGILPNVMYLAVSTPLKTGVWYYYDENGLLIREESYADGILFGTTNY